MHPHSRAIERTYAWQWVKTQARGGVWGVLHFIYVCLAILGIQNFNICFGVFRKMNIVVDTFFGVTLWIIFGVISLFLVFFY